MKCPNCNAEVTGRFCSYCGSEISRTMPNVHIEHNESIINNYGYTDTENKMQKKENKKNIDNDNKSSDGILVIMAILVILFAIWWNGIF